MTSAAVSAPALPTRTSATDVASRLATVLLALAITLPTLNRWYPAGLPGLASEYLAAALGTAAVALALPAIAAARALPRFAWPGLAFLIVLAVQMVVGRDVYVEGQQLAMLYVALALAVAWAANAVGNRVGLRDVAVTLASAVLAASVIQVGFALVQRLGLRDSALAALTLFPDWGARPTTRAGGNLGSPNYLATYLLLGGASAMFLWAEGRLRAWAATASLAWLGIGIALTGSRLAALGILWLLAWSMYCARRTRAPVPRRLAGFVALWAFTTALASPLVALLPAITEDEDLASRFVADPSGYRIRLNLYVHALRAWMDAPLLGHGIGGFMGQFLDRAPALALPGIPYLAHNVHNLPLQLLAETGVLGAAAVGVLFAAWLRDAALRVFDGWAWWVTACVGGMLVASLVEFPLWYAHLLVPFAVVLGLGAQSREVRESRVPAVACVMLVALGAFSLVRLHPEAHDVHRLNAAVRDPTLFRLLVKTRSEESPDWIAGLLRAEKELVLWQPELVASLPVEVAYRQNTKLLRYKPTLQLFYEQIRLQYRLGDDAGAQRTARVAAATLPEQMRAVRGTLAALSRTDQAADTLLRAIGGSSASQPTESPPNLTPH